MIYYETYILVGSGNYNDANFRMESILRLEHGHRASWHTEYLVSNQHLDQKNFTLIPTLESIFEDALIILSYAIEKHVEVIRFIDSITDKAKRGYLELYDDFTKEQLVQLKVILKKQIYKSELVFIYSSEKDQNSLSEYQIKTTFLKAI